MRRISNEVRKHVLALWLEGYTYRNIAEKENLGIGARVCFNEKDS